MDKTKEDSVKDSEDANKEVDKLSGVSSRNLPSGSEVIDEFLSGGYEKDIITTIYGPGSTGKTTFCLLASIATARHGKKVIFVDTEGGFSILRFNQLCDDPEILKSIFFLKPTSFQEQDKIISRLNNMISEQIGLIVVDTIGMLYRVEYGKKQNIKNVNSMLSVQINMLTEISRKHNIPVLLTNQVYTDFDERESIKVVGGDLIT